MRARLASLLRWAVLFGLWLLVFDRLRGEWSVNPQYSFGWLVPPLSLLLLRRRWRTRPEPDPRPEAWFSPAAFLVPLALSLLPLRVLLEANSEWRLANVAFSAVAVAMGLLVAHRAGGPPWLRHFAFPALFPLVAVPWPARFEAPLTRHLMDWVTAATVDALNWLGVACVQQGSVVELATGFVGVEEACSGVHSLHATLMVALFLGEWSRLGPARRVALVAAGMPFSLATNFIRTFLLAWIAAKRGPEAVAAWHDPAGFTVLVPCFAFLGWLSARWESGPVLPTPPSRPPRPFPVRATLLALAWLLAIEGLTEAWYRIHELSFRPTPSWSLDWARAPGEVRPITVPRPIRDRLHCDEVQAGTIRTPDGRTWSLYYLRWKPGRDVSRMSDLHVPEGCLPSAGWKLERVGIPVVVPAGNLRLHALPYHFTREGRPLLLFVCRWESVPGLLAEVEFTHRNRWCAAIEGRRNPGAQVLQATLEGANDPAAAALAFQELARAMVVEKP